MQSFVAAFAAARFATLGLIRQMLAREQRLLAGVPQKLPPTVNADEPLVREIHNDCATFSPLKIRSAIFQYTDSAAQSQGVGS
jgi:hypothetical protein